MTFKKNISPRYNPKELEKKWYSFWLKGGFFHAMCNKDKSPYCIVIPPPNVTGLLHIGHAFNNTLQDILIRTKRMEGYDTLWMPGTDHAGIATQNVVERALLKEGKKREDLGRDAFIKHVWEWKEKHGNTIINQLKRLGASCDWERERFTMDEGLSRAVKEAFCKLYNDGLIYRGYYLINWCPRCQTALADEEVEHIEKDGAFYYIKYFFIDNPDKYLIIATTRPETMLGDTAVAVNPNDERYKDIIGKHLILPLVGRKIPIIASKVVDRDFGTGALKITPAHDPNDYEIGKEFNLEFISVMDERGYMNENAGNYRGLNRYECRKRIIKDLEMEGHLVRIEPHRHAVGHCYRCHTEIEPSYSKQWFVRMSELAKPALAAVKNGNIRFYPSHWVKIYENWLNDIRDWCISRQIWWGHRIPVFYCNDCEHQWADTNIPTKCPKCNSKNIRQDDDVLDTWFSSSLWPFSTLGWPYETPELKLFYPTNALVTGFDIIFFWVARMIMMGLYFMGDIPFRDVYIHALVRDEKGRKMSKSLGNAINPLEVIEQYGADALRFTLSALAVQGRDIQLSMKKIESYRNFMNKLWNAHRYILINMDNFKEIDLKNATLTLPDRWILSRLERLIENVNKNLKEYRFSHSALAIYEFIWDEFCDWYIEISKVSLNNKDSEARLITQNVLIYVLDKVIKLLHPYTPFITEEIRENLGIDTPLVISEWPEPNTAFIDDSAEERMLILKDIVRGARNFKAEYNIPPKTAINIYIKPNDDNIKKLIEDVKPYIKRLVNIHKLDIDTGIKSMNDSGSQVVKGATLYFPLKGIVDMKAEKARLNKERERILKELEKVNKKLSNQAFLTKAKPIAIEKQKNKKQELTDKLKRIERVINCI